MRIERDHVNRRIDTLIGCALLRLTLSVRCRHCPHRRRMDSVPVWYLFRRRRWSEALIDVPRRLYCGACLKRIDRKIYDPVIEVTNDAPDGGALPYPSEREWKRITNRYRS